MSAQRPWVKLWKSWLLDPDIARLSLADQARWIHLLLLVAEHGEGGVWYLRGGGTDLPPRWRVGLGEVQILARVRRLPGIEVRDDEWPSPGITIRFKKWAKYQVDASVERTKRWRQGRAPRDGNLSSHSPIRDGKSSSRVTVQEVEEIKNPPTPLRNTRHTDPAIRLPDGSLWTDPHDTPELRIPD